MKRFYILSFLLTSIVFISSVNAQNIYTIHVKDIVGNVDFAAVTFGDSTKYTDKNGNVVFFNPLVGVEDEPIVPESFSVSNAYPNPVENDVNVDFNVENNKVKFEVYNAIGQEVASGESDVMPGSHSLKIRNVGQLPSGVYFVKLDNGKESYVRKFVNLNSGNGGNLNFSVSNSGHTFFMPKSKGDSYIVLHVEKPGYIDYDAQVDPSQTSVDVDLEREGKTLAGNVYDNESFEPIDVIGMLYYNGNEVSFTTTNGFFDVQVPKSVNMIDSLKVWNDSTFILTQKNIPFASNITNAGIFVTTYKNLNVIPELFYDFVMEVATGTDPWDPTHPIVSIDFQNASRDYTYWIDKDAAFTYVDSTIYDTLSNEEQHHIANVITDRFYSHMLDSTHMPKFYFAKSGEIPPLRSEGGVAYGTIFVVHKRGGNGYNYGDINYGDDYLLDASQVSIGDPTNVDGNILQEAASIISSRTGSHIQEIGGQSVFSEVYPTEYMTGIDIKLLKIEENILHDLDNPTITPIQEYTMPNGTTIQRFYYPTGVEVKDVLGKH